MKRRRKLEVDLMQICIMQLVLCFESHSVHSNFINLDSALTKRLMQEAYAELEKFAHPDPYVHPHMPGGSSFMRNSPPPLEVCFPSGIPHRYIE